MKEKKVYQVNNKPSKKLKEDLPDNKTYYTNKPYDKLQVNFVEINSVYDQCTAAFLLQSALYKYIKTGCIPLQKAIVETSSKFSSTRPILKATAKLSTLSSGFAFRD